MKDLAIELKEFMCDITRGSVIILELVVFISLPSDFSTSCKICDSFIRFAYAARYHLEDGIKFSFSGSSLENMALK